MRCDLTPRGESRVYLPHGLSFSQAQSKKCQLLRANRKAVGHGLARHGATAFPSRAEAYAASMMRVVLAPSSPSHRGAWSASAAWTKSWISG